MSAFFDSRDVAEVTVGVQERWLRRVPVAWQDDVMEFDRTLRIAWSDRAEMWAILRRSPGHTQRFDDGVLEGWNIVTWFQPKWRPPQMIEYVRGMVDGQKYSSPEAAYEAIKAQEGVAREAMLQQMRDEDAARIDEAITHEAAITRDYERERADRLDQTSRAHAHTKVGGVVGGLV